MVTREETQCRRCFASLHREGEHAEETREERQCSRCFASLHRQAVTRSVYCLAPRVVVQSELLIVQDEMRIRQRTLVSPLRDQRIKAGWQCSRCFASLHRQAVTRSVYCLAPAAGLEPATKWLTATYSTIELRRNKKRGRTYHPGPTSQPQIPPRFPLVVTLQTLRPAEFAHRHPLFDRFSCTSTPADNSVVSRTPPAWSCMRISLIIRMLNRRNPHR